MLAVYDPRHVKGKLNDLVANAQRLAALASGVAVSRRTALLLMTAFGSCLVIQAIVPQHGTVPPLQYALWRARYGVLASGAEALGLDNISSMWWFWALGFALAASLALSVSQRAISLLKHGPEPRGATLSVTCQSSVSSSELLAVLSEKDYRVFQTGLGLRARKGLLGPWGSLVFHGSLVMLIVGALISASTRFTGFVELAPGQRFNEANGYVAQRGGHFAAYDRNLTVDVQNISVEYWPDGSVKDIEAGVTLHEKNGSPESGEISRNKVLKAGESSMTLGSPQGPAVLLRFTPDNGGLASQGYVHFSEAEALLNSFSLPGSTSAVEAEITGPWREALTDYGGSQSLVMKLTMPDENGTNHTVEIALRQSASLHGGDLTFVDVESWALFMVSRDRGLPILVIGGILAIAGLALALFIAPRWLEVSSAEGGWHMTGQTPWNRDSIRKDLDDIVTAIRRRDDD